MSYRELLLSKMISEMVSGQDKGIMQDIADELFHSAGFGTIILNSSGRTAGLCCDDHLRGLSESAAAVSKKHKRFKDNLQLEGYSEYFITVYPLLASGQQYGTLVAFKDSEFSTEELTQLHYIAPIVLLLFQNSELQKTDSPQSAKNVLHMLSYSELKAAAAVITELDAPEGRVVASKISAEYGVTRSVIVNALRKLESAGVLESRSLGVKGTYVKILNPAIVSEIKKF